MVPVPAEPDILALDPAGNVVALIAGSVTKFRRLDGRVAWRRPSRRGADFGLENISSLVTMPAKAIVLGGASIGTHAFSVVRVDAHNGRTVWRTELGARIPTWNGSGTGYAETVAVGPNGDVAAAGRMANADVPNDYFDFAVAKLAGDTGVERWRFTLPEGGYSAFAVAFAAGGDVVASGFAEPGSHPTVVELADATGAMRWRQDLDFLFNVFSIATDPQGDVFLAGSGPGAGNDFVVVKLSGSTGDVSWLARESASEDRYEQATRVAVDGVGGVVAAGMTSDPIGVPTASQGDHFTVARYDVATGARLWIYREAGDAGEGFADELAITPSGTVVAAGRTAGTTTCLDGFLVALDLSTGEVLGSRTFDGRLAVAECHPQCLGDCPVVDSDRLTAMAADDHGRVVVGGSVFNHDVSTALNFVKRLRIRARHARTPQLPSRACRSSALAMH